LTGRESTGGRPSTGGKSDATNAAIVYGLKVEAFGKKKERKGGKSATSIIRGGDVLGALPEIEGKKNIKVVLSSGQKLKSQSRDDHARKLSTERLEDV